MVDEHLREGHDSQMRCMRRSGRLRSSSGALLGYRGQGGRRLIEWRAADFTLLVSIEKS